MKKDSNSNKKKLKLRRLEEAEKSRKKKRHKKMVAARVALVSAPKKPFNKKKLLLAALFALFLINPSVPFFPALSLNEGVNAEKMCSAILYKNVVNPRKLFVMQPVKKKIANQILHNNISKIIKGTPMEKMTDAIANRDETTAAFIVGIAMKESKFGKFSPKKDGKECFNYWGYRGRENTTKSGYSCFDNPDHAIQVVGDRIARIVKQGARTPEQMISWKCGSTCAGHSPESVDKWIADVGINYYRIQNAVELARK
ncbi:hypothetical protein L6270_04920 [Candidatus Parcubacteria bacterium]|nr:hypothetical protein [Patescibacteria group bacterium]MBU4309303.1 hypothetical protein [Patescibacteria group bacterium]MBU4432280.1 hypothetical protein [Patescibacteria group bacterium]MBU4577664.1 hypothetical protein [Patescibacteria group bacterium]MCG2697350.1 hypothetical protein [Candidatus Parcubacteria bacterium]